MADYSRWMCFRSLCTPGAPCNELTCGWEDVPPAVAAMIDLARVATPHPATPQAPTVDSVPDRLPDGVYRSEDTFWMVRHWWDDLPAGWIRRGDADPAHEVFAVMPDPRMVLCRRIEWRYLHESDDE